MRFTFDKTKPYIEIYIAVILTTIKGLPKQSLHLHELKKNINN